MRSSLFDDRLDPHRPAVFERVEQLPPRTAFDQYPHATVIGDMRVPLAFDPRAGRHRGRDCLTNSARVVFRHPLCQRDNLGG
jgi:hypothetical protein